MRRYTFARNDLLFTMSDNTRMQAARRRDALHARISFHGRATKVGLLSRSSRGPPTLLRSYGATAFDFIWLAEPKPRSGEVWWSQTESNRRPPACKAGALPTELWPLVAVPNSVGAARLRHSASAWQPSLAVASEGWWAWEDLNFRPHAYQARALTN